MNTRTFEAMSRHAAAMSRRGSLLALGGAALASAIPAPTEVAADKKGRQGRKGRNGNNEKKRCQRQRGQCLAYVAEYCEPKIGADICKELFNPCCEHFASCNAGQGIECLFSKLLGDGGG